MLGFGLLASCDSEAHSSSSGDSSILKFLSSLDGQILLGLSQMWQATADLKLLPHFSQGCQKHIGGEATMFNCGKSF